jgi:hypothetical protein
MSWWHKMPADAGRRPEILAVGWAGFCAWRTLMGIDAQQDFNGRIPRRFTAAEYLFSQNPPDGPGAETYAMGLLRCVDHGLATWDGNELVLDSEIYEDWRGAKSAKTRKHEERQRERASRVTNVTRSHECHAESRHVTHVTPPDQTRPDQTRPESEPPAPAHHGSPSFDRGASIPASVDHDTTAALIAAPAPNGGPSDIQAEAWRLAQLHDQLGMAVAKTHGASWRSLQNSGPRLWLATLQGGETEDACRHVLTILAAEADERARLSVRDPLRFLRTPTTPDIWLRATGLPDEETARESVRARTASGRGPGSGQDPSPEPARRLKRLG